MAPEGRETGDGLDPDAVRRWGHLGVRSLARERRLLDNLNVYPVHDRDTGANMLHTWRVAATAMAAADAPRYDVATLVRYAARAALTDAAGTSGHLLVAVLYGFADGCGTSRRLDVRALRSAVETAASSARASLGAPADGTILDALDASARAARQSKGVGVTAVIRDAHLGAVASVPLTKARNPRLAAHDVVDAGALGWAVLLRALRDASEARVPTGRHPA